MGSGPSNFERSGVEEGGTQSPQPLEERGDDADGDAGAAESEFWMELSVVIVWMMSEREMMLNSTRQAMLGMRGGESETPTQLSVS